MKKSTTVKAEGMATVKAIVLTLAGIGLASLPISGTYANPQDGQVVAGSAAIRQETPNKIGITQTTDKAIIDWRSYSIGANEHVQYYQPSAASVTLNRVVGADPSQILGRLTANGQVFLVNPNGIFFGKNAQIDVAGLVASTHNIRNEDFLAGRYLFNIPGNPGAAVINEGDIRIADTCIAAFVAPSVANRGVIVARLGKVALASANGYTLDFTGDELLTFLVSDEVAQTAFDLEGNQLTSFVENAGHIEAQGGYVLLTAKAAENAIHGVINQTGSIEATTVGTHNGTIILNAGTGSLHVAGTLDASAPNGGDGGYIDTSGAHVTIDPKTRITTAAPSGKTGTWLIDPTDYTIAASGGDITGAALATYLGASNVEIQTLATGTTGQGDIFVNDAVTWNSFNKLTLTAHRNINVNQAINAAGGGSVKLRADSLGTSVGTVNFAGSGHITANNGAAVGIYYNPISYTDTATKSDRLGNPYSANVTLNGGSALTAYMLVNDVNQLQAIDSNLGGNYALGKNIDASATAGWNAGAGFSPIGSELTFFIGSLDGQNNTINNLSINRPSTTSAVGLFGVAYGSSLKNVGVVGASIYGGGRAGGLVGTGQGTSITNSYATGSVSGVTGVGGLVGIAFGTVITNSYATVNVSGGNKVGGLVGYTSGTTITTSYATGDVSASNLEAGGLVGQMENGNTITKSYATGNVSGTRIVGGLVGSFASSTIANSYATGNVRANDYVGGLVGSAGGGNTPSITNSYATGSVSVFSSGGYVGTNIGGLLGSIFNTPVTCSYWDTTTSGQATSAGGTGLTTAQMMTQASFAGWDFTNTWTIQEGASYPTLRISNNASSSTTLTPGSTPVTPVVTPPNNLTPAQTLLIQQHQNDSVFQLLTAIADGLFTNSNTDPVWVGLYQNGSATPEQVAANEQRNIYDAYTSADIFALIRSGQLVNDSNDTTWHSIYRNGQATAAQVDANAFANTYNQYQGRTANALFAGIVAGDLNPSPSAANAVVWDALKNQNLSGTNRAAQMAGIYDTYKNADVATLASGLSMNPPDLVYGDTVWNALIAVNATNLTAAYNAYTNPAPTSTLTVAQQQLVNMYEGKPADHLFWALVDTPPQFTNAPTDPVWSALYVGGSATQAQRDANAWKNTFDNYRNAGTATLLQALKDSVLKREGYEVAVWEALTEANPNTRTALASYMTYLANNSQTLPNDPTRDIAAYDPYSGFEENRGWIYLGDAAGTVVSFNDLVSVRKLAHSEDYSFALMQDGRLDPTKLSDTQVRQFLNDAMELNVQYLEQYQLSEAASKALAGINDANAKINELATKTTSEASAPNSSEIMAINKEIAFSTVGAIADLYSGGMTAAPRAAGAVTKILNEGKNWSKLIAGDYGTTSAKSYLAVKEFADFIDSKEAKIAMALISSGIDFSATDYDSQQTVGAAVDLMKIGGPSVETMFKDIPISRFLNTFAGESSKVAVNLATSLLKEGITNGLNGAAKEIVLSVAEAIPVVGNVVAVYNKVQDINDQVSARTDRNNQAVSAAVEDLSVLINKVNSEISREKLNALLSLENHAH